VRAEASGTVYHLQGHCFFFFGKLEGLGGNLFLLGQEVKVAKAVSDKL
jgi:hypothetical protein